MGGIIMKQKTFNTRMLVSCAVGAAISFVLMLLDFSLPIAPAFIKLDLSDLPALILAFSFGPFAGLLTELVKNLLHLLVTTTAGVGELSNFLLGCAFVVPAGLIYQRKKTRKMALLAMLAGTVCYSLVGIFSNYFIMFPFYTKVSGIPMEAIIGMCQKVLPFVDNQWKVILLSVTPFNILKGLLVSLVTFLIYKRISPLLRGRA
ncbi:MAG: ECF transporter S component [Clostridia bacterium]|nr:ECF transporter S component [Clostridia bacterium]